MDNICAFKSLKINQAKATEAQKKWVITDEKITLAFLKA